MLLKIPNVLVDQEVVQLIGKIDTADFVDGASTAGLCARRVKNNLQLPHDSALARELGSIVLGGLSRNVVFYSATLPRRISPPLSNRYGEGMQYGNHVDNALMGRSNPLRTDVSGTLFLSAPESYDGAELVVQEKGIKLRPVHFFLYPSTSQHRVESVTRGMRYAAVFWVETLAPATESRRLLFELDMSVQRLRAADPDSPEIAALTDCCHNLLRMCAEA